MACFLSLLLELSGDASEYFDCFLDCVDVAGDLALIGFLKLVTIGINFCKPDAFQKGLEGSPVQLHNVFKQRVRFPKSTPLRITGVFEDVLEWELGAGDGGLFVLWGRELVDVGANLFLD